MKRFSLAMLLSAFLCIPCAAYSTVNDPISEVPFSFEKGLVLVQAKIKRDVPVEMILATGSEHSFLDSSLLQKYKLQAYYSAEPPITGRNDRLYSFSTVPDIRVGDMKETSLSMRFGSLAGVSKSLGREVFGILGADFFKGRVVEFNFEKRLVRFLSPSSTDTLKDNKSSASGTDVVLPMRFYKESVTLPIVENVTFEGKKVKTLIDTGTVTVVSLSPSATKQLGFSPPPEDGTPRNEKIKSLRFNDYELTDVPVLVYGKGSILERQQNEYGAIAGAVLLQNFVATFDFRKKIVILKHL